MSPVRFRHGGVRRGETGKVPCSFLRRKRRLALFCVVAKRCMSPFPGFRTPEKEPVPFLLVSRKKFNDVPQCCPTEIQCSGKDAAVAEPVGTWRGGTRPASSPPRGRGREERGNAGGGQIPLTPTLSRKGRGVIPGRVLRPGGVDFVGRLVAVRKSTTPRACPCRLAGAQNPARERGEGERQKTGEGRARSGAADLGRRRPNPSPANLKRV